MEYDTRMVREVLKRVEGSEHGRNLKVIQGDVLKVCWMDGCMCVLSPVIRGLVFGGEE